MAKEGPARELDFNNKECIMLSSENKYCSSSPQVGV